MKNFFWQDGGLANTLLFLRQQSWLDEYARNNQVYTLVVPLISLRTSWCHWLLSFRFEMNKILERYWS